MLDRPATGRIFFEQVIRDDLDLGRPDQVGLIFNRRIVRKGRQATPGRFRTRVITAGVTPSLHVDYKHNKLKQYHKQDRALRTETTINETRDFGINKGLNNLPRCGRSASPPTDASWMSNASATTRSPEPTRSPPSTTRSKSADSTPLRFGDRRAHALLVYRLHPRGFTNRDLRTHLAGLLGTNPDSWPVGRATYDLRRLRLHGLIERIPHTHRYQVTTAGLRHALFLTRLHDRVIRTGAAHLADPDPPARPPLRAAARRLRNRPRHFSSRQDYRPETQQSHQISPAGHQT